MGCNIALERGNSYFEGASSSSRADLKRGGYVC